MPLWIPLTSIVVTSWLLTCTGLPWCGWSTVGTHFSEWVQIFQKNSFRGEPILGGSKLNFFSTRDAPLWCWLTLACETRQADLLPLKVSENRGVALAILHAPSRNFRGETLLLKTPRPQISRRKLSQNRESFPSKVSLYKFQSNFYFCVTCIHNQPE